MKDILKNTFFLENSLFPDSKRSISLFCKKAQMNPSFHPNEDFISPK